MVWDFPRGLLRTQMSPGQKSHFMPTQIRNRSVSQLEEGLIILKVCEKRHRGFQKIYVVMPFSIDCRNASVTSKRSLIRHLHVGTGIFTAKLFRVGQFTGSYYESMVLMNLTTRQHVIFTYEKHIWKYRGYFLQVGELDAWEWAGQGQC